MREVSHPQGLDIHYRSSPGVRTTPPSPVAQNGGLSSSPLATPRLSPRLAPLLPSASHDTTPLPSPMGPPIELDNSPRICGMPLKYVSYVSAVVFHLPSAETLTSVW